tara:strand:+ start:1529 stop:2482 length:954 start_codon:yes stop_codon:yes gene_type:complete
MSALAKNIDDIISQSIQDFVQRIADTYELDPEDIMSLWDDHVSEPVKKSVPKSVPKVVKKPSPAKSTTSEVSNSSSIKSKDTGLGCPYVFARGENKGQVCGCKPQNGNKYCSKHKKYEGEPQKEKKVLPNAKKSIVSPSKKPSPKEKTPETILRKHKILDKYWNRETDMVFKSGTERIVIGKCLNDKLVALTAEDIEVCKSRRWKYEEAEEDVEDVAEDKKPAYDIDFGSSESDEELEKEMKKAVRKVTATSKTTNDDAVKTKKSLKSVINGQTEDVENILSELQKPSADDSDEELEEEEDDDQELYDELDELEEED